MSQRTPIPGHPGLYLSGDTIVYRIGSAWLWSKYKRGQEPEAARALKNAKQSQAAQTEIFGANSGPVTADRYVAERFFPQRRKNIEDWKSDETRLNDHVLNFTVAGVRIGDMALRDIRTRHLRDCFLAFREKKQSNGKPYAPKSIWNTYGVVRALFRDAKRDELVFENPCALDERDLGENVDADPEWRDGALFERGEAELLMGSALIPDDRKVWYALLFLAAVRTGEGAALRWRHWDTSTEPLGGLLIANSHDKAHTKTKRARKMPVHPALATILSKWKMSGWPLMMGRHPQPDDLIVPVSGESIAENDSGRGRRLPLGAMRTEKYVSSRTAHDLRRLGLRHRRGHDLRATLITWALVDGAKETPLRACTHTPKKQAAFDAYNRIPWPAKCEAVASLKMQPKAPTRGELIQLRVAAGGGVPLADDAVTQSSPVRINVQNIDTNKVEAAGIEPVATSTESAVRCGSMSVDANEFEVLQRIRGRFTASGRVSSELTGDGVTDAQVSTLLSQISKTWENSADREALSLDLARLLVVLGGGQ